MNSITKFYNVYLNDRNSKELKSKKYGFAFYDSETFDVLKKNDDAIEVIGCANLTKKHKEKKGNSKQDESVVGILCLSKDIEISKRWTAAMNAVKKATPSDAEPVDDTAATPSENNSVSENLSDTISIVHNEDDYIQFDIKKEKVKKCHGYVKVSENTYVQVVIKKNMAFILIPFILLAACTAVYLYAPKTSETPENARDELTIADGTDWDGENNIKDRPQAAQENINIPGYTNLYANSEDPYIKLINPDGNTVYLKYIIKNGEETIYETDLIRPGQMLDKVDFTQLLEVGEYNLTFVIQTYDVDTQAPCNGLTQTVSITIED